MEKFATLQEIIEIYCISWKLVRDVLRHYKVDFCKQEDTIYINLKEFHQIYTKIYNPALFTLDDNQKWEIIKPIIESKINRTFMNIFTTPVDYHIKKLNKFAINYAG